MLALLLHNDTGLRAFAAFFVLPACVRSTKIEFTDRAMQAHFPRSKGIFPEKLPVTLVL
jgi:hypothetical protein